MNIDNLKLYIDGRWELSDLNTLSRVYIQIYSLIFSLEIADDFIEEDIQYIYGKYPWMGGYSAVNFYQNLYTKMPREYRPQINSIQYASPGFIELGLLVEVAKDISIIVGCVSSAIIAGNKTYSIIHKEITKRKLSKIDLRERELQLLEKEHEFIKKSVNDMASVMGVNENTLRKIYYRTENNEFAVLKILSSLYRRARDLARLQIQEKLNLSEDIENKKDL